MATIVANNGVVTQINVFTVSDSSQQPLIDLLVEAANVCRDVPGWMSASIHRSIDGTRVTNYAQCDSMSAWEAVMDRLKAGGFLERNRALGVAHPGLYEVVYTVGI